MAKTTEKSKVAKRKAAKMVSLQTHGKSKATEPKGADGFTGATITTGSSMRKFNELNTAKIEASRKRSAAKKKKK